MIATEHGWNLYADVVLQDNLGITADLDAAMAAHVDGLP